MAHHRYYVFIYQVYTLVPPDSTYLARAAVRARPQNPFLRCGPCRGFTPQLVSTYDAVRAAGKAFEIVLIGSDRSEAEFLKYHKDMPWLALPFQDRWVLSFDPLFLACFLFQLTTVLAAAAAGGGGGGGCACPSRAVL